MGVPGIGPIGAMTLVTTVEAARFKNGVISPPGSVSCRASIRPAASSASGASARQATSGSGSCWSVASRVAYELVEVLPPDVLTPPDGTPALPMLISIFVSALFWNVLTSAFGIPNTASSALWSSRLRGFNPAGAPLSQGVDWRQIWKVLEALTVSPILGLVLAGSLYGLLRLTVRRGPPVRAARGRQAASLVAPRIAHLSSRSADQKASTLRSSWLETQMSNEKALDQRQLTRASGPQSRDQVAQNGYMAR